MIDVQSEQLLKLREAANLLPGRNGHPSVETVYRWTKRGCRGVVLESVKVGGLRCTSREAIQRFCERLTSGGQRQRRTEGQKRSAVDRADRRLAGSGFFGKGASGFAE